MLQPGATPLVGAEPSRLGPHPVAGAGSATSLGDALGSAPEIRGPRCTLALPTSYLVEHAEGTPVVFSMYRACGARHDAHGMGAAHGISAVPAITANHTIVAARGNATTPGIAAAHGI